MAVPLGAAGLLRDLAALDPDRGAGNPGRGGRRAATAAAARAEAARRQAQTAAEAVRREACIRRAAPETKENVNRKSPDKKTQAPAAQAPPPPTPGAPPKSETQAPAPTPADEQKAQSAPPAHDLTPSPQGELPAEVNPKPKNETAEAAAPAAPAPPAKAPVGEALPTIEDLPQYQFAREAEHSPVASGNADTRYLTIVYGMIKAHLHETAELRLDSANRRGVVDFYVDEGGNLVGRKLISSSGSPNLDLAVMAAIAAAAPYPAPPNWSPLYLTYNFGKR